MKKVLCHKTCFPIKIVYYRLLKLFYILEEKGARSITYYKIQTYCLNFSDFVSYFRSALSKSDCGFIHELI